MLIIAGEADIEAPFEQYALWLKDLNTNFRLESLGSEVGHYEFLCNCTNHGKNLEPGICTDSGSVLRDDIHTETVEMINRFFAN